MISTLLWYYGKTTPVFYNMEIQMPIRPIRFYIQVKQPAYTKKIPWSLLRQKHDYREIFPWLGSTEKYSSTNGREGTGVRGMGRMSHGQQPLNSGW